MDPAELGKKVGTYADAVTAFAVLQGLAFLSAYASHSEEEFTDAMFVWLIMLNLATLIYLMVLFLFHSAENSLLGKPTGREPVAKWTKRIRKMRYLCVLISFVIVNTPIIVYLLGHF